jgi:hypothetical protein
MSRSIIPGDMPGRCYLCSMYGKPPASLAGGSDAIEVHHIFGGPKRRVSEHYGLKVHLCVYHHREGPDAVHNNRTWDLRLKRTAEKAMIERYGEGVYMQEIGRDYGQSMRE